MKTRVQVVKVDYTVNEKAITCRMLIDTKWDSLFDDIDFAWLGPIWHKKLRELNKDGRQWIHATVQVMGDDKFDIEKGKKLARVKASMKAYRIAIKMYYEYERLFGIMLNRVVKLRKNCIYQLLKATEYREELWKRTY